MSDPLPNRRASPPKGPLLCSGLILGLFLVRFFYVTESAAQGDTLWIVGLWFVALLAWTMVSWKSEPSALQPSWLDLSVGLLAGGHIISALVVVTTTGDKRSAINLAWEWMGVATGWLLLRQQCQQFTFRRELLIGLVATGTSVAGLGLYQHYVAFPQMSAKYGPLFDRLRSADATEAASIRQVLAREQIPTEDPALTLFEKRLRDSREPLGLFALANSLAGFLAVCLILTVSVMTSMSRRADSLAWKRMSFWIAVVIILSWCLLLTKSRTAWIGTAIGLVLLSLGTKRVKVTGPRLRLAVGMLVVLVVAAWGLSRIGGLDRQVFTEAPKSLQYRLQYWSATLPMIGDHFLWGVGPGQFRAHYLFYKRAEASEEITDPHNLFLDAAANGGLAAVVGLLALCVTLALRCCRSNSAVVPRATSPGVLVPCAVSGLASVAWLVLLFTGSDDRLLILLPMAVGLFWGLRRVFGPFDDESNTIRVGSLSAAFGLLVHLCGAGGIGMPAVSLLLLALVALVDGPRTLSTTNARRTSSRLTVLLAATTVGLMMALFVTAWRPVAAVQEKLLAGDRLLQRGLPDGAEIEYSAAAAADIWSGVPWRRQAELAYRKAEADQFRSNDSFLTAVHLLLEARSRDPANFQDDRRLGESWLTRWSKTKDIADASAAAEAFERAWGRYPTNAALMAELAFALESAESEKGASDIASQALRQDEINRERRHVDRFLSDPERLRLEKLAAARTK